MASTKLKAAIAGIGGLAIALMAYQYFTPKQETRSAGYQATEEDLAYLEKKYEKKINKPKRYDKPKEAMQFYVDQRKPIGASNIPVERYESARQQMMEMPRINSGQAIAFPSVNEETLSGLTPASSTTNFSSWTALGPGNVGGRTRTLAINPSTPDTMYTAGVSGGIWKTTNGGTNWTPLNDLMNNMAVTTIVIDPSNHDTLYAGTGEGFFNGDAVRGDGIFKSTDGGANWTHLSATSNNANFHYVNKLAVSSNDSNRIYAATRGGVFRSTDGGTTWSSVRSASTFVGCLDIQVRTDVNPDVLITSCGSFIQSSIYRSVDGGDNWTQVLTETNMGRTTIAIAPSNQSTIYALSATTNNRVANGDYNLGLHAVFKSTDGGATWNPTVRNDDSNTLNTVLLSNTLFAFYADCGFGSTNQFFNQGWYDNIIAVDPVNENIVWAGGIDLFRSDDGGNNWGVASKWWGNKTDNKYVHADQHGIYFHPDYNGTSNKTAFFSHDGGLSKTTDARATVDTSEDAACNLADSGFTFTSLNNDYAVTQFYHGLAYPDGSTYFGGTQDNGTNRGTTAAGTTWEEILDGDGGYVAVDPNNTNTLFAESQNGAFQKSTDGGANFTSSLSGVGEISFSFITPFIMDPNNSQNLWIGGRTLWKTTDQADSWTQASTTEMLTNSASAWAVATGDSNYVAVGEGIEGDTFTPTGIIHYTTSASTATGSSSPWSTSTPAKGVVSSLIYDPNNKNILYATYSTFGIAHIWKSTDAGATWTAIDNFGQANGIPDIPVHVLAIDPDNSNRLFAGTDLGIFVSTDGGASWAVENTGFTNTVVENLQILDISGTKHLFAFTHGRGAWRTTLATTTDTTPDQFTFADQTDVAVNTQITSLPIMITGIDSATPISISGGEYRITSSGVTAANSENNSLIASNTFTNANGTVNNNDNIEVRHTSSANNGQTVNTVLTVGGISDTFSSTTIASTRTGDTTPDQFSFTDQTDVEPGTQITSVSITVTGIDSPTNISITGGEYSINGGAFTNVAATGAINNNDTVTVRHTSSTGFNSSVDTVLTIGGVSDTFTSTTRAADTTPDQFSFTDQTDVEPSTQITSALVIITGIDGAADISITGGEYSINGGAFTSAAATGAINNNDSIVVRHTSSSSFSSSVDTSLTIGGVSDTFTSTTRAADTTPNQFSFTDQTDVEPNIRIIAAAITVTGIDGAADISITGGEYSINGGAFTNVAATGAINNNDTIIVSHASSSSFSSSVDTTLTIGGVSDTFTSTTRAADTTPDQFSFTDQTGVEPSTRIISAAVTVTGIDGAADISITGGEYSINGGAFTSAAATGAINNNDTIIVSHASSSSFSSSIDTTLTIGGVSDTFTSTTRAADTTPNQFSFTDQTDVELNTQVTSATITVSGFDSAQVSISGGEYSINGGTFTSTAGSVSNGAQIQVRHTSSTQFVTATDTLLTIGGISDTFTSTTRAVDVTPDAFSFTDQTDVDPNTEITSDSITVSGIEAAVTISVRSGEYSINNAAFTTADGTVNNGDTVRVRHTSAIPPAASRLTRLTIGGVVGTFTTTTSGNDGGGGSFDLLMLLALLGLGVFAYRRKQS